MLMVRRNYDALVSGDGACAGCGEKSVLRSIAAVTEAYMRPVYPRQERPLRRQGRRARKERRRPPRSAQGNATQTSTQLLRQAIAHLILGLGGEDD